MTLTLYKVIDEVLSSVLPSLDEKENVKSVTELVRTLVIDEANKKGLKIDVEVGGSVAKNTWLKDDVDIDFFMLFPTTINKKELGELGLDIAKKAVSRYKKRERYAEHPYLEAWVNNIRVNIVPCYKSIQGQWRTAADRSPYHTRYIVKKLETEHLEKDIRVFKKFIKGIDNYGAEIRVKGFSGYLCELLILHYGFLQNALNAISKWRFGEIIDSEKVYQGRLEEAKKIFNTPLIVIDPVDPIRNVAAAVSKDRMSELITATKLFLERPSRSFFYPEKIEVSLDHLKKMVSSLEYDILAIDIQTSEKVPDVLWGELIKTQNALKQILQKNSFNVLRSDIWSDEEESSIIIFSIETKTLSKVKLHIGPPVDTVGVEPFLEKYMAEAVTGPWVENGKWVVGVKREYTITESLLKNILSDGGFSVGVSRGLVKALISSRLLVGAEVLRLCSKKDFPKFLKRFLEGKPQWLSRYYSSSSSGSSR